MSIKEWQMYHGAALSIIINEREYQAITKLPNHTRSEYMLNNDKGLYIKQAVLRREKWQKKRSIALILHS